MTDMITVNYECIRSARSIATVNTAGKILFNWETVKYHQRFWTHSPNILSSVCHLCIPCNKNRNTAPQLRPRWFPEACVTHINQRVPPRHGRSCGLGKKGWREIGREFEQVTSQWTPWQRVKERAKGPLPRVTARSHTVLHLFPAVLFHLLGTNACLCWMNARSY